MILALKNCLKLLCLIIQFDLKCFWRFKRNLNGFLLKYFFGKYLTHAKINSLSAGATHEFLKSIDWLSLSNFLFFQKIYFFSFLNQSCLAEILDHHLNTKWPHLWSPTASGPVCNFWLRIARKSLLTTFFNVFLIERNKRSNKNFSLAIFILIRPDLILCHRISFKLTGKKLNRWVFFSSKNFFSKNIFFPTWKVFLSHIM